MQKDAEKKLTYKYLSTDIQRMRNMKWFVIPDASGATGIVTKGLKKYPETVPGKHSIHSICKKQLY
jgi:hypothetical protein